MDLITREEFEELLGAFALDACDAEETAAVEQYMTAHPDVDREVERLRTAAAGLAASDALAPPRDVRNGVFERARRAARRVRRRRSKCTRKSRRRSSSCSTSFPRRHTICGRSTD